jgi:hypothetical protein
VKKSLVGAAVGGVTGLLLALLLFWAGPKIIEWIKGPPRFETEAWVFYLTSISGLGLGAIAGAIVGAASSLTRRASDAGPR